MSDMTEDRVRAWVRDYAWMGSDEDKDATTDCIMRQDDWRHVTMLADRFAGAQFEPGPAAFDEGIGFALSALYECHDGPHLPTCPSNRNLYDDDDIEVDDSGPETMPCYACGGFDGVTAPQRRVTGLGPVLEAHRDPTTSYRLECGHLAF